MATGDYNNYDGCDINDDGDNDGDADDDNGGDADECYNNNVLTKYKR